jgi:hypothetical protein
MMDATLPPSSPTATQVVVLGVASWAHDTACRFDSGVKEAVVCQVGVAADEGSMSAETATPIATRDSADDSAETTMLRTVRTAHLLGP